MFQWDTSSGIGKKIRSRVNCFECSPTRIKKKAEGDQTCIICGKKYTYYRGNGTKEKCASCLVNDRRNNLKLRMVLYKGGKCALCGYNKCMKALTFHHIDPTTKEFNISGNHCRKWEVVQKELDKCVLLCSNCHAEVEDGFVTIL
jgi:hypothetical protein